jgi:hypothetical protein
MEDTVLPAPTLTHIFSVRCRVDLPIEIGPGPFGNRRCVNIRSGTVTGKYVQGEVCDGGADFLYVSKRYKRVRCQGKLIRQFLTPA